MQKILLSIKEDKEKNVPMAQTTCLASFGPIFVVAAFHLPLRRVFRRLHIYAIKHKLVSKRYE
jgi:hypothetical protein